MTDVVIAAAVRSAVGRAHKGALAQTRPDDLAGMVVRELLARVPQLSPAEVDDLVLGCAMPEGEQALLKDFIRVKAKTGVSNLSAKGCADSDQSRQQELGGQYVQRTNNYRRDNPDNCSAPLSDFVGSIYDQGSVGVTVPCDGDC